MSEFERRVVDVLHSLGPGEVVSYGDVAEDAGATGIIELPISKIVH